METTLIHSSLKGDQFGFCRSLPGALWTCGTADIDMLTACRCVIVVIQDAMIDPDPTAPVWGRGIILPPKYTDGHAEIRYVKEIKR